MAGSLLLNFAPVTMQEAFMSHSTYGTSLQSVVRTKILQCVGVQLISHDCPDSECYGSFTTPLILVEECMWEVRS